MILKKLSNIGYDELSDIQKEKIEELYDQRDDGKKVGDVHKYISSEKLQIFYLKSIM